MHRNQNWDFKTLLMRQAGRYSEKEKNMPLLLHYRETPKEERKSYPSVRPTADGYFCCSSTSVWEIQFRYLNAEISIAEPTLMNAGNVPLTSAIWMHIEGCQLKCAELNLNIKGI